LDIASKELKDSFKNTRLSVLPMKLPMIVKPNPYTENSSGGYLLNNVKYHEHLIIRKKAYSVNSKVNNKRLYDVLNNLSSIPFKVNKVLLDLLRNNSNLNLLIDPFKKHKYADMKKKTKIQENEYRSHNSAVVLQENILEIADFYSKVPEFYFPLRMDQRGRFYASPSYFNYQSNELAKSLLLFRDPGVISKKDSYAIHYFKSYGAICFGISSNKSVDFKVK
jgi:DNA-directed RNA polymerase